MINFTDSEVMIKPSSEHGSAVTSQVDFCKLEGNDLIKEGNENKYRSESEVEKVTDHDPLLSV